MASQLCRRYGRLASAVLLGVTSISATSSASTACTATFTPISASAWVEAANAGWNLGNTLDATPTEGSWNNPPVVPATFDDIKNSGFKSVRIPVTYIDHFVSGSPDWTVDPTWLARVSAVVDMALSRGLYVITNVHHDATDWADVTASGANLTQIEEKFSRLWTQIGQMLACKSSLLALEPINEPPANAAADYAEIAKLNEIFVAALAASGGFNAQRVVTLVGPDMDAIKTSQYFKAPSNFTNPWAIQYHYYSPYDFIFGAWGKTIWGSAADLAALESDLSVVRGNFSDVPLYIGEFSASPSSTEAAARWRWTDALVRTARGLNASVALWDNGADNLDRAAHAWRDPTSVDIIVQAAAGAVNSLPDSTTDTDATAQNSSAFVFHRVGDAVADAALPWLFNGNKLVGASVGGAALNASSDYSADANTITFTPAFLSRYLSPTAAPGVRANVTLSFSAGAPVVVQVVQWDVPVLGASASAANASAGDLAIPVAWKGVPMVAAVKMQESDGTYLFDTWTQYLPALQQSRGTYSNDYNWDDGHVIITAAAVQAVVAAKKSSTFTFEFYPRVPGNNVTYTLHP